MNDLVRPTAGGPLSVHGAPNVSPEPQTVEQRLDALRADVDALTATLAKLALNTHNQAWTGAGCPPQGIFAKAPVLSTARAATDDVFELTHQLAYEAARNDIESFGVAVEGELGLAGWYGPPSTQDTPGGGDYFARGVRYLRALQLIEFHPINPVWVCVKDRP